MQVLGVVGTMVWDTIWRPADSSSPIEEWGGISYALAAADIGVPAGQKVRPLIKLGRDLAERGRRFLGEISAIETHETVSIVDTPNPRVELRYRGVDRIGERLQGGVPPWTWPELAARLEGCDALYVNFITGAEMDLEAAKQLRRSFQGPIYADLHSLLLGTGLGGERHRRPLERWSEWLACYDAVQVNEDELRMLSTHWGDPWAFAAAVVGHGTRLLLVTQGSGGAAYVATHNALPLHKRPAGALECRSRVRTGRQSVEAVKEGDSTGCGDVWGITVFRALAAGWGLEPAMRLAHRTAGRNLAHHGASGLNRFLRGEIERVC
jgi:sugar/nucleoside kinase (ribokinase family)